MSITKGKFSKMVKYCHSSLWKIQVLSGVVMWTREKWQWWVDGDTAVTATSHGPSRKGNRRAQWQRWQRRRDIGGKESGQDWYRWGMPVDTWIAIEIHVKQEVNHANKVISTVHATDYEPREAKGDCIEGEEDNERVQISRGSCTFMAQGGAAVGLHVDYCWLWKTVRLQVHWWSQENNGSVLVRTCSDQKSGKGKGRGCVQDMVRLLQ